MVILDQDSAQKKTQVLSQNSDFRQFNPAARWNAGIVSFSYCNVLKTLFRALLTTFFEQNYFASTEKKHLRDALLPFCHIFDSF